MFVTQTISRGFLDASSANIHAGINNYVSQCYKSHSHSCYNACIRQYAHQNIKSHMKLPVLGRTTSQLNLCVYCCDLQISIKTGSSNETSQFTLLKIQIYTLHVRPCNAAMLHVSNTSCAGHELAAQYNKVFYNYGKSESTNNGTKYHYHTLK